MFIETLKAISVIGDLEQLQQPVHWVVKRTIVVVVVGGGPRPTGPGSRFTTHCTQPRKLCNVLLGVGDIHKRSIQIDVIVFLNI